MKIYTKTGDQGQSSLFGGTRVDKNHWRLEAYGTLDELNSFVGKVLSELHFSGLAAKIPVSTETQLLKIQSDLFNLGSHLACEKDSAKKQLPKLDKATITELEKSMDEMNLSLRELKTFILPSGHIAACSLHVCRTIARRAERRLIDGLAESDDLSFSVRYLNRLSDYFFVVARFINFHAGAEETPWTP